MPASAEIPSGLDGIPVYLNNAATSFPKPPGMAEEVAAWIRRVPRHAGRSGSSGEDVLSHCRKEIAGLIVTDDPERIVLCSGATAAANMVLHGLGLESGPIVTTAAEHNSILRPLYRLAARLNIRLEILPCNSEGRVREDLWRDAVERWSPKLAVLNHASNVTGAVHNASALLGFARRKGCLTVLDASQTAGAQTLDATALNADVILFTGHKNLGGPAGTGGFFVRDGLELDPLIVGGTGVRSELKTMPPEMPTRLEAGTPAECLFAGLLSSLRWLSQHSQGPQATERMTLRLEEGLRNLGAEVVSVRPPRLDIISFRLPGWTVGEAGYVLDRSFGILCRSGLHCAPLIHPCLGTAPEGTVRFSLSRFTTEAEIDYTLESVGTLIHGRSGH